MFSEWVYRRLLLVYPKEHRWEYGEPMVQPFRDGPFTPVAECLNAPMK